MGSGFLWVSPEVQDRLKPGAYVGAYSVREPGRYLPHHFDLAPGARRFETGTGPELEAAALEASVNLLLEVGLGRVERRVRALGGRVAAGAPRARLPGRGRGAGHDRRPRASRA
jgi:selenocysteine lyase/cysteine desulfurase